jgi:colicin import membrane protein
VEHTIDRPQPGKWLAAAFSLLMHGVLLFFLYYGVHWQSHPPEAVSAELVSSLPPPPVAEPTPPVEQAPEPVKPVTPPVEAKPEPMPVKPDIALKEPEKKKPLKKEEPKAEQSKPQPKPEKKPEPKPEKKPEPVPEKKPDVKPEPKKPDTPPKVPNDNKHLMDQLDKETARVENAAAQKRLMQREMAGFGGKTGTPSAGSPHGSDTDKWKSAVRAKVSGNIHLPPNVTGRPTVEFEVELDPTGMLESEPRLTKSSGNALLDEAIRRAIKSSAPFPKPPDAAVGKPNAFKFDPLDPNFLN